MEEDGKVREGDSSGSKKKIHKMAQLGRKKNLIQNLMYRDFGIGVAFNATKHLEPIAETHLVLKDHRELKCNLPGEPRATFLMVFSPDGTKVASTHGNHFIYVTDLTTGKNIKILSGHPRTPWCIAFHPWSNDILASGCLGGQVRVWDLSGGSEVWNTESETAIASLAFHPSERLLVIATYNEIHFWDWSKPEPFAVATTGHEKEKVRFVAFDKSGKKLITGIENIPKHSQSQWDRPPNESFTSHFRNPPQHLWRRPDSESHVGNSQNVSHSYRARAMAFNDRSSSTSNTDERRRNDAVNQRRAIDDTSEDDTDNDSMIDDGFADWYLPWRPAEMIRDRITSLSDSIRAWHSITSISRPASRTVQSPTPQTGSVTIEVRRNDSASFRAEPQIVGVVTRVPTSELTSPMEIDENPRTEFVYPTNVDEFSSNIQSREERTILPIRTEPTSASSDSSTGVDGFETSASTSTSSSDSSPKQDTREKSTELRKPALTTVNSSEIEDATTSSTSQPSGSGQSAGTSGSVGPSALPWTSNAALTTAQKWEGLELYREITEAHTEHYRTGIEQVRQLLRVVIARFRNTSSEDPNARLRAAVADDKRARANLMDKDRKCRAHPIFAELFKQILPLLEDLEVTDVADESRSQRPANADDASSSRDGGQSAAPEPELPQRPEPAQRSSNIDDLPALFRALGPDHGLPSSVSMGDWITSGRRPETDALRMYIMDLGIRHTIQSRLNNRYKIGYLSYIRETQTSGKNSSNASSSFASAERDNADGNDCKDMNPEFGAEFGKFLKLITGNLLDPTVANESDESEESGDAPAATPQTGPDDNDVSNDDNNNNANENNNGDDENGGEQSESGYWLLEENSHSDSNEDGENGEVDGNNENPSSRRSRWIPVRRSNETNVVGSDPGNAIRVRSLRNGQRMTVPWARRRPTDDDRKEFTETRLPEHCRPSENSTGWWSRRPAVSFGSRQPFLRQRQNLTRANQEILRLYRVRAMWQALQYHMRSMALCVEERNDGGDVDRATESPSTTELTGSSTVTVPSTSDVGNEIFDGRTDANPRTRTESSLPHRGRDPWLMDYLHSISESMDRCLETIKAETASRTEPNTSDTGHSAASTEASSTANAANTSVGAESGDPTSVVHPSFIDVVQIPSWSRNWGGRSDRTAGDAISNPRLRDCIHSIRESLDRCIERIKAENASRTEPSTSDNGSSTASTEASSTANAAITGVGAEPNDSDDNLLLAMGSRKYEYCLNKLEAVRAKFYPFLESSPRLLNVTARFDTDTNVNEASDRPSTSRSTSGPELSVPSNVTIPNSVPLDSSGFGRTDENPRPRSSTLQSSIVPSTSYSRIGVTIDSTVTGGTRDGARLRRCHAESAECTILKFLDKYLRETTEILDGSVKKMVAESDVGPSTSNTGDSSAPTERSSTADAPGNNDVAGSDDSYDNAPGVPCTREHRDYWLNKLLAADDKARLLMETRNFFDNRDDEAIRLNGGANANSDAKRSVLQKINDMLVEVLRRMENAETAGETIGREGPNVEPETVSAKRARTDSNENTPSTSGNVSNDRPDAVTAIPSTVDSAFFRRLSSIDDRARSNRDEPLAGLANVMSRSTSERHHGYCERRGEETADASAASDARTSNYADGPVDPSSTLNPPRSNEESEVGPQESTSSLDPPFASNPNDIQPPRRRRAMKRRAEGDGGETSGDPTATTSKDDDPDGRRAMYRCGRMIQTLHELVVKHDPSRKSASSGIFAFTRSIDLPRLRARAHLLIVVQQLTRFFEINRRGDGSPVSIPKSQILLIKLAIPLSLKLTNHLLIQWMRTRTEILHWMDTHVLTENPDNSFAGVSTASNVRDPGTSVADALAGTNPTIQSPPVSDSAELLRARRLASVLYSNASRVSEITTPHTITPASSALFGHSERNPLSSVGRPGFNVPAVEVNNAPIITNGLPTFQSFRYRNDPNAERTSVPNERELPRSDYFGRRTIEAERSAPWQRPGRTGTGGEAPLRATIIDRLVSPMEEYFSRRGDRRGRVSGAAGASLARGSSATSVARDPGHGHGRASWDARMQRLFRTGNEHRTPDGHDSGVAGEASTARGSRAGTGARVRMERISWGCEHDRRRAARPARMGWIFPRRNEHRRAGAWAARLVNAARLARMERIIPTGNEYRTPDGRLATRDVRMQQDHPPGNEYRRQSFHAIRPWFPAVFGDLQQPPESYVSGVAAASIARGSGGRGADQDFGNINDNLELGDHDSVNLMGRWCRVNVQSYRVQAWDFSNEEIPDVSDPEQNVVVRDCKIKNDASIGISSDGELLTTLPMSSNFKEAVTVGVFSLQWETLGELVYSTEVYEAVVSLSFSPTKHHLLVGLSSRRSQAAGSTLSMALIYKFIQPSSSRTTFARTKTDKSYPLRCMMEACRGVFGFRVGLCRENNDEENGEKDDDDDDDRDDGDDDDDDDDDDITNSEERTKTDTKGKMVLLRRLVHENSNNTRYVTLNCIRWAPQPGQGMVYATSNGQLNILH